MPRSWYPRLATLPEVLAWNTGGSIDRTWPPPGTVQVPVGHPETWALLIETSYGSAAGDDGQYGTTLSDFVARMPGTAASILARVASQFVGPLAAAVGVIGQWPVVWSATEGESMRWIRNTVRGSLGGGVEQWQFKMDWGTPGADPSPDDAALLALAVAMKADWAAWFAALNAWFPTSCTMDEVGCALLEQHSATNADGTGGDLTSTETQWAAFTIPVPTGASTSPSLPFEVACAVTLQTDHRGPSGRGRFYVPAFQINAMDDGVAGQFEPGTIGALNSATKAVFDAVRASGDLEPLVVSRRRMILNRVTSIATGHVPDSQRRRRRSQDEARVVLLTP
jgi:hypothetical protein